MGEDLSTGWLVALSTAVTSGVLLMLWRELAERRAFRTRQQRLDERDAPSFDAWLDTHYRDGAVEPYPARRVLELAGEAVGVAPTKLLPQDRLRHELDFPSHWYLVDDPLEVLFESLNDARTDYRRVPEFPRPGWTTLDDVIRTCSKEWVEQRLANL